MCELFFFVKDFSGTAATRILDFGIKLVLCKRESASSWLSFPFIIYILFSFYPITEPLAAMRARLFKFVHTLSVAKYIVGKKTKML